MVRDLLDVSCSHAVFHFQFSIPLTNKQGVSECSDILNFLQLFLNTCESIPNLFYDTQVIDCRFHVLVVSCPEYKKSISAPLGSMSVSLPAVLQEQRLCFHPMRI